MALIQNSLDDDLAALRIDRSGASAHSRRIGLATILIVLCLLAGLGAGVAWKYQDQLRPAVAVKTDSVRVMTLGQASAVLTATGYLESRMQAAVGAKVPGRVTNIPVEEGMRVKKGDLLAEIEHTELDAALASRKLGVEEAEAALAEAQDLFEQAERDLSRERELDKRSASSLSRLETIETNFSAARARFHARRAALASAKARVVEAEEQVRNMFIFAPFAGTVIQKDAEVGESIMPGGMGAASGRGSVVTLADMDQLEVDTDVKEDYLGQLRRGQPAEVRVDAVDDRHYKGKLREIIPMGDRSRGVVKVKVAILDADERLFPELSATVNFLPPESADSEKQERGLFVPLDAVTDVGGKPSVWLVEEDRVRAVPVATAGSEQAGLVQITGELKGGETLVVSPPKNLNAQTRVRVAEG